MYYLDFIYPFIYGTLLVQLSVDLKMPKNLFILGYVAGALDLTENTGHALLVNQVIPVETVYTFLAATAAGVKWSLVLFLIVLIITNLGQGLKKSF